MRKKLFAVIMSVMMMVTFMPAMAFAGTALSATEAKTVKWAADYTSVTWTTDDGVEHSSATTREASGSSSFNGLIEVKAIDDDGKDVVTTYYDLNNAYLSKVNNVDWKKGATSMKYIDSTNTYNSFLAHFNQNKALENNAEITFNVPSYVDNYAAVKNWAGKAFTSSDAVNAGFKINVTVPKYDTTKMYTEDQNFTVSTTMLQTSANATTVFYGDVPARSLKVLKIKAEAGNAAYMVDGKTGLSSDGKYHVNYTAEDHTFAQVEMPGVTSTYEMFNAETGKWEATDAVKVKNVGEYLVKTTAKDSTTTASTIVRTISVEKVCDYSIGFEKDSYDVAGKVDPMKYIVVKPSANKYSKVVKLDEELIKEYTFALYELTTYDNETYYITEKDLTPAEKSEINAKYEALTNNYNSSIAPYNYAKFNEVVSIDFTKAPLTKTYKAKKGKLAKNKTFSIKAKASDGQGLYYQLTKGAGKIVINKSTGKVTVKKGLKKGTYKVGVYALTLKADSEGNRGYNNYTLKIKVK